MPRYMDYSYCCPTAQSVTASIYLLQRGWGERGVVACLHCRLIGIMRVKSLTASASGYSHFHLHCPFSSTFPFHALRHGWEEGAKGGYVWLAQMTHINNFQSYEMSFQLRLRLRKWNETRALRESIYGDHVYAVWTDPRKGPMANGHAHTHTHIDTQTSCGVP